VFPPTVSLDEVSAVYQAMIDRQALNGARSPPKAHIRTT
jgi:hypothetical protein